MTPLYVVDVVDRCLRWETLPVRYRVCPGETVRVRVEGATVQKKLSRVWLRPMTGADPLLPAQAHGDFFRVPRDAAPGLYYLEPSCAIILLDVQPRPTLHIMFHGSRRDDSCTVYESVRSDAADRSWMRNILL